ncbi:MAG: anhydro-N-acetylmuramic acid kinase [Sphingobacteriia bacterium]|nr:MAG: anhydro-N-acetylmuramic acid kinase [Sphingobacteriia bacterium]TAG31070.1 MAG: anhydro-N-acetylmuramic acid kinase [Sphingobacteriia bacterium]
MNPYIQKLAQMGSSRKRLIIGLMSGTSLDGLDIALCAIEGSGMGTTVQLLQFKTVAYNNEFKELIRSIFAKHEVDLEQVCLLNAWVADRHAEMINKALKEWGIKSEEVDLIASHGQTIYHAPKILHGKAAYGNATLQIGDGDHIAVKTGIITVSDFRQKHIAAGGEGAPLAVYGDYFIFSKRGENRMMLNIGGIANFTFLPGNLNASNIFSTDTGPGNTLMDAYMQAHFNKSFDENAAVASQGEVNDALLLELKKDGFFLKPFPKTTGPELFNLAYLQKAIENAGVEGINHFNTMATLNRFSADTITDALLQSMNGSSDFVIYSSGGGMHNSLLMNQIKKLAPACSFYTTGDIDILPDAKEAVLFAVLANEHIAGGTTLLGTGAAGIPSVTMGKISFPV